MNNIKLINNDCLLELDKMEDNSVDSIVTDPPYHLTSIVKRFGKKGSAPAKEGKDGSFQRLSKGFMGKEWDGGDIAFDPETWEKCLKVLKPGGYMLCFGAPRNYHRMAVAIEDAGFEIRDCMMYMFGSGFPKSHNVSLGLDKLEGHGNRGHAISAGSQHHPTTGKKRANGDNLDRYEPKSELGKKYDGWGTGLLKPAYEPIIVARKSLSEPSIAKNIKKWGTGGHNVDACRIPTKDKVMAHHAPKGTFVGKDTPSAGKRTKNCHDGKEPISGGNGSPQYQAHEDGRFPANILLDETAAEQLGGASRFFYTKKPSKHEKNAGLDKNSHPTVKPIDLLEYLIKLVTPIGGTVLDPFCGSGSCGIAAQNLGFSYIGIELEKEYYDIAQLRLAYWKEQLDNIEIDIFADEK